MQGILVPLMTRKMLPVAERTALITILETRFEANPSRHPDLVWSEVLARLERHPDKVTTLAAMESSGGEPDVVGRDADSGEVIFFDCSPESPPGRTSLCYDREGLESRKEPKPRSSALETADRMGVALLTEEDYSHLQTLGEFDRKTSSWLATDPAMRKLGGALFGDRRFGRVFFYHNGAQSYYSARGFRASLRV